VGGTETLRADVRVISATNRHLLDLVDQGKFREDLYYRVAGIDVSLPPLRERRQDIPALAEALLARLGQQGKSRYRLTRDAVAQLKGYDYPGNVRELRNILQKAAALSPNGIITAAHIRFDGGGEDRKPKRKGAAQPAPRSGAGPAPVTSISEMESRYIRELLTQYNGHRRTVADVLGISERTLYRKLNRYRLRSEKG
jgi:DNA-binding NtrC family response regulator